LSTRREILVDTGAWVALAITRDAYHNQAVSIFEAVLRDGRPIITTNHVIAETYTLILRTGGHARAIAFLRSLRTSQRVRTIHADAALEENAAAILEQYSDQQFSYVDAVSFALMRQRTIEQAFAFDRHFLTAGFTLVTEA
jgi:uncharacterized protein